MLVFLHWRTKTQKFTKLTRLLFLSSTYRRYIFSQPNAWKNTNMKCTISIEWKKWQPWWCPNLHWQALKTQPLVEKIFWSETKIHIEKYCVQQTKNIYRLIYSIKIYYNIILKQYLLKIYTLNIHFYINYFLFNFKWINYISYIEFLCFHLLLYIYIFVFPIHSIKYNIKIWIYIYMFFPWLNACYSEICTRFAYDFK